MRIFCNISALESSYSFMQYYSSQGHSDEKITDIFLWRYQMESEVDSEKKRYKLFTNNRSSPVITQREK